MCPTGGVSVQPPADAGTGQTTTGGKGERRVSGSTEARAEEPSNELTFLSLVYILFCLPFQFTGFVIHMINFTAYRVQISDTDFRGKVYMLSQMVVN
jgi:hypothetical protein